jgi:hypothetical protein
MELRRHDQPAQCSEIELVRGRHRRARREQPRLLRGRVKPCRIAIEAGVCGDQQRQQARQLLPLRSQNPCRAMPVGSRW